MKPNQITYKNFRSQQKSFSSTDGDIKYIDQGKGDVILLLHGVPTSGWLYRNMIEELSKTHRVIVPDMLGYGSSNSPKGYAIYSEENHAKRLLALMQYLEINQWTHIMHDAGGLWTLELIKKNPLQISNLIILNSVILEEGFDPPIRFKKGFIARTAMWAYRNGITTNLMLKNLFKSGMKENDLNKVDVEGYKTPLKEGKTRGMYYFFTQTCNELPDYSTTLKNLNIPISVIWGQHDEFLLWEPQQQHLISTLNISEENIHLLDAKHFIQEEKPKEIVQLILNFLK
ncbi:oxidoreductase [Patiriisocius marinistellae]|uniref:Oxidoreductase n=1 Tax=Patiriisocius marinistellae TaxID=2494560 RepID=A0A5J4FSF1_9FLAO|nr:alpha/beta hydrolase [Patiriisocius marinistellae]GEQ84947.1 oxidoreductase [Patiriisocius marinistellae]